MPTPTLKRLRMLSASADAAAAEIDIGEPAETLRVQMVAVSLGGKRSFTVYSAHVAANLEFTIEFKPANPLDVDCGSYLPVLLTVPGFVNRALVPLLDRVREVRTGGRAKAPPAPPGRSSG